MVFREGGQATLWKWQIAAKVGKQVTISWTPSSKCLDSGMGTASALHCHWSKVRNVDFCLGVNIVLDFYAKVK